ncbi:hypothetical protein Tco_1282328 [Tanacetum coccineum]
MSTSNNIAVGDLCEPTRINLVTTGYRFSPVYALKTKLLKNFKKDGDTSFQDEERYEHAGAKVTRSQEEKRLQDDKEMIYG